MSSNLYIKLARQDFRFSAAHMTVFGPDKKEPLHGHNYTVELEIHLLPQETIPFETFKVPLREICNHWHEKTLLAEQSPYLIMQSRSPFRFSLCKKVYELPEDEVVLLPVDNITCEALAQHMTSLYAKRLNTLLTAKVIQSLSITLWESPGQGVTTRYYV